jgi:hypothetical protein
MPAFLSRVVDDRISKGTIAGAAVRIALSVSEGTLFAKPGLPPFNRPQLLV